jgi:hypothetical protein
MLGFQAADQDVCRVRRVMGQAERPFRFELALHLARQLPFRSASSNDLNS